MRMAWEIIISLLDVLKNEFVEVDEAMFQGVDGPCDNILCNPGKEKSDFHEVA
jgi:hypothetical protein